MSALLAGHAASLAALGLLLVSLIAVAARLTFGRARRFSRGREERRRGDVVIDPRIRAKLEAMIWPE